MGVLDSAEISSPKRRPGEKSDWYGYYAGYSAEFVRDSLHALAPVSEGASPIRVLDPWNGSGTTTAIAAAQGYETIGLDRNPSLVVIAKARHLSLASVRESLDPLLAEIASVAKSLTRRVRDNADQEELGLWFDDTSSARIRAVERAIHKVLVDESAPEIVAEPVSSDLLTPLASFFYCVLFTAVRQLTAPFRTTNPTWIRGARTEEDRLTVEWAKLERLLSKAAADLSARLTTPEGDESAPYRLFEGSAEDLALDSPADLVLTSPPYCTRIDYVVATKPELVLLGNDADDIEHLRRKMLGTPLTEGGLSVTPRWGSSATQFVEKASSHDSKAANTYYRNYYLAYLRDLYLSLEAICKATKATGTVALVVQDSYFKEIHFDLPLIVSEMGESLGRSRERLDFRVNRTKAAINPRSRAYRQTFSATESLVLLRGDKLSP